MAWLILGVAVVTEIVWALSLKWVATQGSWLASIVPITLSFVMAVRLLDGDLEGFTMACDEVDVITTAGEHQVAREPVRVGNRQGGVVARDLELRAAQGGLDEQWFADTHEVLGIDRPPVVIPRRSRT